MKKRNAIIANSPAAQKAEKDANAAKNEIIESLGLSHELQSLSAVKETAEQLLTQEQFPALGGRTIIEAMEQQSHAIYIGTTGRQLEEEALRWLTERGAQNQRQTRSGKETYNGHKNRPVLRWMGGALIKESQAKKELGAEMVTLHQSRLRLNETNIEDTMQTRLQKYPLGIRLHRYPAKGPKQAAKAAEEYEDPDFLCKTFMTCLPITAICGKRKPEWVEVNRKRVCICY